MDTPSRPCRPTAADTSMNSDNAMGLRRIGAMVLNGPLEAGQVSRWFHPCITHGHRPASVPPIY